METTSNRRLLNFSHCFLRIENIVVHEMATIEPSAVPLDVLSENCIVRSQVFQTRDIL